MYPQRITDERTLTAYHEAGHAVISLWFGVTFKTASIIPDEETQTDGRVVPQLVRWFNPDISSHPSQDELMRLIIHILLAGPEAERRVRGRYNEIGAGSDWRNASNLVAKLHYSETAMGSLIQYSKAVVREAFDVKRCWSMVDGRWDQRTVAASRRAELSGDPANAR